MENRQPKTFEEIDALLQADLKQINVEIEEILGFIEAGQNLLETQTTAGANEEVIAKYNKDIAELQKGLKMFMDTREEIQQTILKLHQTKEKADEHIR